MTVTKHGAALVRTEGFREALAAIIASGTESEETIRRLLDFTALALCFDERGALHVVGDTFAQFTEFVAANSAEIARVIAGGRRAS